MNVKPPGSQPRASGRLQGVFSRMTEAAAQMPFVCGGAVGKANRAIIPVSCPPELAVTLTMNSPATLRIRMLRDHPTYTGMPAGSEHTIMAPRAQVLIEQDLAELAPLPEPVAVVAPDGPETTQTEPTQTGVEGEDVDSDPDDPTATGALLQPFDPRKIDISIKPLVLDNLLKRIRHAEVDLNTPFQRAANLWKDREQSRLIESILIRFPLPAFYFDGSDDEKWLVVDGLQRLSSLRRFVITKELKLTGLEYLTDYEGYGFGELPRLMQRTIEEAQITAYIIRPGTPDPVKFNLFKRINTAGLTLKPQEIRHALNQGVAADFVKELAKMPVFVQTTGGSIGTARMEDRDFVMRFVGFHQTPYPAYQPDLDTFLHAEMGKLAKLRPDERATLRTDFVRALDLARALFGRQAFRKMSRVTQTGLNPINKALFESWTVSLSRLTDDQGELLISRKANVLAAFVALMHDPTFGRSISAATGDKRRVTERFGAVERLICAELRAAGDPAAVPGFGPETLVPPTTPSVHPE